MELRRVVLPLAWLLCVLVAQPASAAIKTMTGFETGVSSECSNSALAGTASFSTTTVRTGTRSLRVNPTTTAVGSIDCLSQVDNTNGTWQSYDLSDAYHEFQFRPSTLPAGSVDEEVAVCQTSGSAYKLAVRANTAGNLLVYDNTGTNLVATGTTALATTTFYRIGIRCGNGTSAAYAVTINGSAELSGTADQGATNVGRFKLGKVTNRNGASVDFFYDDFVITTTAFLGDVEIKVGLPTANGSTMQWTGGTGASDFNEVDELPTSDAEYVQSVAQNDVALFTMQDASTIGVSGTIHAAMTLLRRVESTDPSTLVVRLRSGSTNSDSAGANLTGTIGGSGRLLEADPATTVAWTTSGIDGVEVGGVQTNTGAARIHGAYLMVAYTPSGGGGGASFPSLLRHEPTVRLPHIGEE